MFTVSEIKKAVCGKDNNGETKTLVTFGAQTFNTEDIDKEPVVIAEESSLDAEIKIDVIADYTYITLIFPNATNEGLSLIYRGFESYLENAQAAGDDEETVCFLSLMPLELGGDAYVNCMFPIFWAIEPDYAGGEFRRLRIVYKNQNVLFLASSLKDEDLKKVVDVNTFSEALTARNLAIENGYEEEDDADDDVPDYGFSYDYSDFGDDDDSDEQYS